MPLYLFECGQGHKRYEKFGFKDERPHAVKCECGGDATFRFNAEFQLNTRPVHLSDGWRSPLSASEQLEQTRNDMKKYEESWTPNPEDS